MDALFGVRSEWGVVWVYVGPGWVVLVAKGYDQETLSVHDQYRQRWPVQDLIKVAEIVWAGKMAHMV